MEGILEYINALEDAQKQSKQANNPITDDNFVLIATNAMLTTKQLPCANKQWEDLDQATKFWDKWKAIYKSADKKAKIKHEAAGGKDQFGAAYGAEQELPDWGLGKTVPIGIKELDGTFNNLAAAATNEKAMLEELVKSNAVLTKTNPELSATNKTPADENHNLRQEVGILKEAGGGGGGGGGAGGGDNRGPKNCPN